VRQEDLFIMQSHFDSLLWLAIVTRKFIMIYQRVL